MSFVIKDDSVLIKYNDIWNKFKKTLDTKFHNKHVYDDKFRRTKVKTFNGVINTIFWGNKITKEKID